jgi:uncharacterized protein
MDQIIKEMLQEIESNHNVKILYACESGSRAWGFASPDSDYDVRFVYVHPKEHYLSIEEQRDVIELPINDLLDINGWELRKALRLFKKSNAPLYEWLQSPIVYLAEQSFASEIQEQMSNYFSPRAMMHHYLSMAKSAMDNDLSGSEVKLKKYFYAVRPILACRWIADCNEVPPMEFGKLRRLLDANLNQVVDDLLVKKSQVGEKFVIKPIAELHAWLKTQIEYCESHVPKSVSNESNSLNELFRKYVK